jgi:hypothetical protein
MGAFEDGSSFLAGVLAKLPEEKRAQVKAIFEDPEAKDAVVVIGDGVLARPDYSKKMNDLQAEKAALTEKFTELNTWYEANQVALTEYKTMKPEYERLKGGTPDPLKPIDPRQAALDVVNEAGAEYVQVSAWLADKSQEHKDMFGERVSLQELVRNPKLGKPIVGQPGRVFSLADAYTEKYGERVAAKQQELHDKAINDEVEKRLGEERKKLATQPFPLRGEPPSVLDALQTKDGSATHTLDTAVNEYERLQQARGA